MKQTIRKEKLVDVEVEIDTNDIFNWLTQCNNAEELEYLGKYALRLAKGIKDGEDVDIFRSL